MTTQNEKLTIYNRPARLTKTTIGLPLPPPSISITSSQPGSRLCTTQPCKPQICKPTARISIYGRAIPLPSPIRQLRLSRLAGRAGEQQHPFPECAPKYVYVSFVPRVSPGKERLAAGDRSRAVFVLVGSRTSCSIVDACLLLVLLLRDI